LQIASIVVESHDLTELLIFIKHRAILRHATLTCISHSWLSLPAPSWSGSNWAFRFITSNGQAGRGTRASKALNCRCLRKIAHLHVSIDDLMWLGRIQCKSDKLLVHLWDASLAWKVNTEAYHEFFCVKLSKHYRTFANVHECSANCNFRNIANDVTYRSKVLLHVQPSRTSPTDIKIQDSKFHSYKLTR
jgi:hypothetical protein